MLSTISTLAHTIYAPNDIPLLDNRFRIDPNTEQVTIILNHFKKSQKIVLVQPDGSKLYAERHPKATVAWLNKRDQDIITIQQPMPGPWQAIANLHGDNRIQLLNPISLEIGKLPLKTYHNEYLTTHVSLLKDKEVITNKDFLNNAKLTVSLVGETKKIISLYKDDGQYYDALPFDGILTTRMFINLKPARYLLSIKTKNNIFIRTHNNDMVVFPSPLTYKIQKLTDNTTSVKFTFTVDNAEILPESVTIDSLIESYDGKNKKQLILHLAEQHLEGNKLTIEMPLEHEIYTYSGSVFATTKNGREINFKLPERTFELTAPYKVKPVELQADLITVSEKMTNNENTKQTSQYFWWLIITFVIFIVIATILIIYIIKRKKKNASNNELSLEEVIKENLEPTSIE